MKQLLTLLLLAVTVGVQAQRTEYYFKTGWRFSRTDAAQQSQPQFDDSGWQQVTVPHDWAIYGPFSKNNDSQNVAIEQDGQTEATEHSGRTGGLPFIGVGWYRLQFEAPAWKPGMRATLVFDGAMSHARIYINGKDAGGWIYGYNSFYLDVSQLLQEGTNTMAVRLENETECSRWYPGAGLYRNVHLVVADPRASVKTWGVWANTRKVLPNGDAVIDVKVDIEGTAAPTAVGHNEHSVGVEATLIDADGREVAASVVSPSMSEDGVMEAQLYVSQPKLWSTETPNLYTLRTTVMYENKVVDRVDTRIGIRSIEVRPNEGFFLNGKKTVFKGTCNHHDLGPLGAAVNESAIRRQVRMLKDMGCNAYRTSHNMPAPELVRICDEEGMMVMAESFDEWKSPKVANGYHKYFEQWIDRDVENLVRQFRSSPSVVMWCIGNEVSDQGRPALARRIQDIFHRLDPSRPCTQGMDRADWVVGNNMAATMDVPGFNYRPWIYPKAYKNLPQQVLLGSETASTISSRGVYKFPVERTSMAMYDDNQASSYDLGHCNWSDLPEDNFICYEDLPYDMGEFVWTGFDYLGEPTPYYSNWPSHSSLFGIIDLAGIPKDRYYLYRSVWNTEQPTLHILPHWTFPGREGEVTPVFVYSSYPNVELYVNGVSQGIVSKDKSIRLEDTENKEAQKALTRQKRYRHMWMNTKYEPGTLRAVAYDENGNKMAEAEVQTAGKPYAIRLTPETSATLDGAEDLCFVRVEVVDRQGRLCPNAMDEIQFSVKGAARYRAGANGDATCLYQFHKPVMPVFYGQMTAIVESNGQTGTATLTATAKGLKSGTLKIDVK